MEKCIRKKIMSEISRAVPFCLVILVRELNIYLRMITSIYVFDKYLLLAFMIMIGGVVYL